MSVHDRMGEVFKSCARELVVLDEGTLSFFVGVVLGSSERHTSMTHIEAVVHMHEIQRDVRLAIADAAELDS